MPGTAALDTLPESLLDEIARHVTDLPPRASIAIGPDLEPSFVTQTRAIAGKQAQHFGLVAHAFVDPARRELFRAITIGSARQLRSLLAVLGTHPHLASFIRRVNVRCADERPSGEDTRPLLERIRPTLQAFGLTASVSSAIGTIAMNGEALGSFMASVLGADGGRIAGPMLTSVSLPAPSSLASLAPLLRHLQLGRQVGMPFPARPAWPPLPSLVSFVGSSEEACHVLGVAPQLRALFVVADANFALLVCHAHVEHLTSLTLRMVGPGASTAARVTAFKSLVHLETPVAMLDRAGNLAMLTTLPPLMKSLSIAVPQWVAPGTVTSAVNSACANAEPAGFGNLDVLEVNFHAGAGLSHDLIRAAVSEFRPAMRYRALVSGRLVG